MCKFSDTQKEKKVENTKEPVEETVQDDKELSQEKSDEYSLSGNETRDQYDSFMNNF